MFALISPEKTQLPPDTYSLQSQSHYFPSINLQETIDRCLQIAYDFPQERLRQRTTSAAIRDLGQRLSELSE